MKFKIGNRVRFKIIPEQVGVIVKFVGIMYTVKLDEGVICMAKAEDLVLIQ